MGRIAGNRASQRKQRYFERCAALHDSCGARGDAETQRSVRAILERLGVAILETEYSGDRSPCCGYGGLTSPHKP